MTYDVFLSYSPEVKETARRICAFLEAQGLHSYMAYRIQTSASYWPYTVRDVLPDSRILVIVSSEDLNKTDNFKYEIRCADDYRKPIIIFRLIDSSFGSDKYPRINFHWIDGFLNFEWALKELNETILPLLGKAEPVSTERKTSSHLSESEKKTYNPTNPNNISKDDQQAFNLKLREGQDKLTSEQFPFFHEDGGFKPTLKVETPTEVGPTDHINGHGFIDLGLPSGLKWATCNLEAESPEQYGEYYAWGELEPKENYTKENSETYGKDFDWLRNNGYINVNGILTKAHDAASHLWGATWRIPTVYEFEELRENTIPKLTRYKGVKGCLVKSKINGKSIFLPATGWIEGNVLKSEEIEGDYWNSDTELCDQADANFFCFDRYDLEWSFYFRYMGYTIRPVSD